jgi:PAS domain S-box-containing protein
MNLFISHYDKREKRTLFVYISFFFLLAIGIAIAGYLSFRSMDIAEDHIPISIKLWQTFGFAGMAIVLVGAGLALAWRQQRVLFYRAQAEAATALRESEERFRIVFEAANDAIYIANADDQILEVNSRLCEMMGYSREELLKMHVADLQAPEYRQTGRILQNEMERYSSTMFEGLYLHRDGKRIPVEISVARIERPQGDLFISIVRDITERRNAEEALRDSEALYRQAIEVANAVPYRQSYYVNGQDVYYDFIDEGIRQITGYGPEEFNGALWDSLAQERFPLEDLTGFSFEEAAERVRSGVNPIWKCNHRIQARDGKIHWVFESSIELRDENGIAHGCIGMFQDITERKQAEKALRDSQQLLQAVMDNIPQCIFWKDSQLNYLGCNRAFAESVGLASPNDIVGKTDFDLPSKHAELYRADDNFVMKSGIPKLNYEEPQVTPDGTTSWLRTSKVPMQNLDGNVYAVLGMYEDITGRKRAEEIIYQRNKYLLALQETALELTSQLDLDILLENIVKRAGQLMGTTSGYLDLLEPATGQLLPRIGLGALSESLVHPVKLGEGIAGTIWKTREPLVVNDYDNWPGRVSNYTRGVLSSIVGVPLLSDNHVLGVLGLAYEYSANRTFEPESVEILTQFSRLAAIAIENARLFEFAQHELAEHKQAEVALMESEKLYRKMNENSPLGMHFYKLKDNNQLIFTGANPAADKLLGVDNSQFIGKTIEEAFPILSQTEVPERYRDSAVNGVLWTTDQITYEDRQVKGAFEVRAFQTTPGNMVAVFADVTLRKQAEEEIRKFNVELEQRVRERTAQLETTNKELEAFSYSVSHDLRAPLRGIDGWSQALFEDYADKLDEQGRQYIIRVRSETQRMGYLIDDMLSLSRLTRAELTKEHVDLSAIAKAIAEQLRQNEPYRKVSFDIQAGLTAEGDPHLLEAVLANLLGNAFKFTGNCAEARIEFGQTESQGEHVFFVRDNGAGFDMAYSQKLFGAFQRMHTESEFPGTGVGLASVQRVVHRHGGRVWAEAEVNRGATFYFTFK